MMRELQTTKKQTAKSRIEKFLAGDEAILLSADEEKILSRWEYANELLIKKEFTWAEIRDKIAFKHAVSKFTAENDIANAQEIFGRSHKISKRYLIHLHLDRMDRDIEKVRKALFAKYKDQDGVEHETAPDAKEIAALAKLHDAYTYTLNSIPEDNDKQNLPPPILVFNLPAGATIQQPMTLQDALKSADEYVEFEDLKNEDGPEDPQPE